MKRWTLKITLCLLAGAVTTWAVAWGCALWGRPHYFEARRDTDGWPSSVPADWPAPNTGGCSGAWYRTQTQFNASRVGYQEDYVKADWTEFGLPVRAMRWTRALRHQYWNHEAPSLVEFNTAFGPKKLPSEIIPLGFALDTLLYGGVVLGVVEGVGLARRRRRRAKGRCPSCGYDRRGLAGDAVACPECGRGA